MHNPVFMSFISGSKSLRRTGFSINPLLLVLLPEEREEKPQIDLNEFLQQLGILKDECQSEGSNAAEGFAAPESSLKDDDELVGFAEESFNWDALIEMRGIEDHQGTDASSFQGYGMYEEPAFPPSIWNF